MTTGHVPARSATTGSSTRPSRPLRRPMIVDIDRDAASLTDEPQWASGNRNSRTVAVTDRLRVTLTALKAGAELASADLRDTLVVHVLRGQVRLTADQMDVELWPGQLGTVEDPAAWSVHADSDALVLLTAGQPDGSARSDVVPRDG